MELLQPKLRFPEFKEKWKLYKMEDILTRYSKPVSVVETIKYQQIGIRSHGKGIFHKEFVYGKELGNKRVFWIKENTLIINIVFAWELAISKTTNNEIGMIASHRFPMYEPINNITNVEYLLQYFLTRKGKYKLELASPGGAGRNKTLGQKEFDRLEIVLPEINEQIKISNFINLVTEKIDLLKKKKALMLKYKNGVLQKIISQKIRFKNNDGLDFEDWEHFELGELLDYIQPTKYIVKSTDYNDNYKTPVLTAGKSFVLGYSDEIEGIYSKNLPVIIFDDFTTSNKFVDFEFKVKSSAIKILVKKNDEINIKYIYEIIQSISFSKGDEHKRYWISEYSKCIIPYPCKEEQNKISEFLTTIDNEIELITSQIDLSINFKDGLLQKIVI